MIYLDTQERQLGKGQDIAISSRNLLNKNGKLCDWVLVADGHGGFLAINIIKKLITDDKLAEIISEDEPMDALVAYMKTQFIGSNSGITCIIVKIFEDNVIQSWNVGDSQVAIYVNKQLHYISCPHNMKNPLEQVRLKEQIEFKNVCIERMEDYVPVIATKTTMTTRIGEYIHFGNTKLAMSQALGDGWFTGIAPEKFEYTFDPADEVRIIAGTDGYWEHYIFDGPDAPEDLIDNTTLPADRLIDKMEQRWRKEDWQYFWNPKNLTQSILVGYEGAYDDIGLAIWSNRMPTDPLTNPKVEVVALETVTISAALDADQLEALDMWQDMIDAGAKEGAEEGAEDLSVYDDMPGLITDEEFEYLTKVIQEYGTLVELEQEYIRSGLGSGPESLEIKDVLIRCIPISVAKMTKIEMKLKLSNKSNYELQEITNIEIELIKERLAKE
jgi:serine/threonine protein phosphatase PrpC